MNIVLLLSVAGAAFGLLWLAQSMALLAVGEPLAWPLRFKTRKPLVKWTARVMVQAIWLTTIFGTPFLFGSSLVDWIHQEFPTPVPWHDIGVAVLVTIVSTWTLYAVYFAFGWVEFEPRYDRMTRLAKLGRRFINPWPLAALEESVFRGILLEQLLRVLPETISYKTISVIITALAFSAVHFVKPHRGGRRFWQPAYGLFIVGCVFGLAYLIGGRTLWLPIAVHAGAIFGLEIMRLYTKFLGPIWLVGYSDFPQSGLLGSLFVLGLGAALVLAI